MGEIFKPAIALLLVTMIAAACLGVVYGITEKPIQEQKAKTKATAMSEISPAKEFVEISKTDEAKAQEAMEKVPALSDIIPKAGEFFKEDSQILSLDLGIDNGEVISYVVGVAPKGYGGAIEMLVALDTDAVVTGVKIISFSETPGLGANAKKAEFTDKYKGKSGEISVVKGTPGDNEIDAITSATITTKAVTSGVNTAIAFAESLK